MSTTNKTNSCQAYHSIPHFQNFASKLGSPSNTVWQIFFPLRGRGGIPQIRQKFSAKGEKGYPWSSQVGCENPEARNRIVAEGGLGYPGFRHKQVFWSKNTIISPFNLSLAFFGPVSALFCPFLRYESSRAE